MALKDPIARREYHRAYMKRYLSDPITAKKHVDRITRNKERYLSRRKEILAAWKAQGCVYCNESHPAALDAHHLDQDEKSFTIGEHNIHSISPQRLIEELDKCECICANCHRKLHAGCEMPVSRKLSLIASAMGLNDNLP